MSVVVFDIGKTNVKLVLLDDDGRALATRTHANVSLPGPPYPHFDAEGIERWAIAALASLPEPVARAVKRKIAP